MADRFESVSHRGVLLILILVAACTAIFVLPFQKETRAAKGLFRKTESHDQNLPNYDIRNDKTAVETLAGFRTRLNKNAVQVADVRDTMVRGEQSLKERVPNLRVEYNTDLRIPEVIAPDVKLGKAFLTRASRNKRPSVLKTFLSQNPDLIGASGAQIDDLRVAADYTNPDGNLSFVELHQEINGIPVFRGEIKAGFTRAGEMIRVINNFAPGLDIYSLSTDFGDPLDAVKAAAQNINDSKLDLAPDKKASTDLKAVFGKGDSATTAEKMYFPTEPGVAVPAWRVLIWQPVNAYYVIVDALTGTVLWRKNITEDQTQPATYSVYTNPNAYINVAHSPFPFSPGPTSPNGVQGTSISRVPISRIGNEPPYTFNQLGWIPDGGTVTDGNNVQAGLDRDINDGIDPNSEAVSPTRDFTFAYNPMNPNTNTGDAPIPATQTYPGSVFQQGMITQLFYACNWFHDETYRLGFTEAAGNFQNVNFTGQGVGDDRVRAEGQDSSGTNNANFSTAADGVRGRMQMFIFDGPNPRIDGGLDGDTVIHEHTHGLSNRLHGNSSGLFNDMSRGMGEGWSDFYGLSLLSQASDPPDGVYATAAYATYRFGGSFVNNSYYGIRRFPYAIMSSVGGPNSRPFNPLTFADIDQTQMNLTDGAFPRGLVGGSNGDEVHNAGEIWCSTLWEIRARMIARLGWSQGNRQAMQLVMDGMKLAPLSPTFLSERDAIIAAGVAGGSAEDVADMWAGFATRGIGASASIQNVGGISIGGTGTTRVTQAFDLPNLYQTQDLMIDDSLGDNDGIAEPGERVGITIPLTNSTGVAATGVTLQIVGGGSATYGSIGGASTVSQKAGYIIPLGTPCGSVITLTLNVSSSLGPVTFTRTISVGRPVTTFTENFDGVAPGPFPPAGWSVIATVPPPTSPAMAFIVTAAGSDTAPNSMFAADPVNTGGSTELMSPVVAIGGAAATVSFRHSYNTEPGFDGGALEISIAGGAFQDIVAAGGKFLQNGYTATLGVSSPNPLGGRGAWTGNSGGYITTTARLPTAASGQNVQLRWRFGADSNTAPAGGGWNVDSIQIAGNFGCAFTPAATVSVSGRVSTPDGRGLRNARVLLTDPLNLQQEVTTSAAGLYQFDSVQPGITYTIRVVSKLYRFNQQNVNVNGNLANINFVGQE